MNRILFGTLGLLMAFPLNHCRGEGQPVHAPLFISGRNGYHTYRIPSLIVTSKGTILAFCEARKRSASDLGEIDLVLRRSADGGKSWGQMEIMADDGDHTMGNPCPVVDQKTGVIWLPFCRDNKLVFLMKSADDSKTWSRPIEITKDVKDPAWAWVGTGPGHGIQLKSGRLLIPCWAGIEPEVTHGKAQLSFVFFSDDAGKSWKRGGAIEGDASDECEAVELSENTVYLTLRTRPKRNRAHALSKDGGDSFGKPQEDTALIDPVCQGSIARYPGRGILLSHPGSRKREKMTVRFSRDEGKTWPDAQVLHEGPSAYSSVAVLPDGTIGCLYERGEKGPYETLTFTRFSLDWLLGRPARKVSTRRYGLGVLESPELVEEGEHTATGYDQAGLGQQDPILDRPKILGADPGVPHAGPRKQEKAAPSKATAQGSQNLCMGDGDGWFVSGERWSENTQGIISPPDQRNLHSRAFWTKNAFRDFIAEFEVKGSYREVGSGGAGLIFRALDATHFYAVYFPWGGQQLRAAHFWASVVKVEGDDYLRCLKSAWVPGVPSQTDRWYKIRVEMKGQQIMVWVDGRRALSLADDRFRQGTTGLIGFGMYHFRNIRIQGEALAPPSWPNKQRLLVHHFTVGLDSQNMPSGCLAPNGDVLLAAGNFLVRSRDKGRTWAKPARLPDQLGAVTDYGNTMFRTSKGRLMVQIWRDRESTKKSVPEILIAESKDNGHTWTDPVPSTVAGGWPEIPARLVPYGPLVETEDGTLLRFLLGAANEGAKFTNVVTWGAFHARAFAIRSTNGGKTWSGPIELDQPAWSGQPRGTIPGSLDLTEPTGVAMGNKVMVLVRPIYSPMMWQCWSTDAGAQWDAAARTTFPGYAQSMLRTHSGVMVCAHRYPHYSVHLSRDDGLNWDEGTVIDYAFWAMGCLVEVEPNMVLSTYMNQDRSQPLLAQLFRVTSQGISPVLGVGESR